MNRIKDFFYDKNDVIVAFIILLAAAVIIYFRIGDIMKYPETLVHSAATGETTASVAVTETTVAPAAGSDAAKATTAVAETKSITITQDAASTTVAKQLEKAKLVSSAKEFKAALEKYDMAGSIRSGTYQIPVGATNEKIIEIITKQKVK